MYPNFSSRTATESHPHFSLNNIDASYVEQLDKSIRRLLVPSRWRNQISTQIRCRQQGGHLDDVIGRSISGRPHEPMAKAVGFHSKPHLPLTQTNSWCNLRGGRPVCMCRYCTLQHSKAILCRIQNPPFTKMGTLRDFRRAKPIGTIRTQTPQHTSQHRFLAPARNKSGANHPS